MEFRILEVTPISGEDLKDVKLFGKMQTYVVAWVDPTRKVSSNLDKLGGKNPRWNHKLTLSVDTRLLSNPKSMLTLEIYSMGSLSNTIVGRVNIPLQEISEKSSGDVPLSYKVRRPSGRFQGVMHVSVKLGDKIEQPEPAMAYPYGDPRQQGVYAPQQGVYPPQQGGAYPPAPPAQGHGVPYQQGYPPQGAGYPQQGGHFPQQPYFPPAAGSSYGGYPPVVAPPQPPPRRNRFGGGGAGLGMGLAGGLLGGLLLGEMVNDFADSGDYGGGDFGGDFGGGDW